MASRIGSLWRHHCHWWLADALLLRERLSEKASSATFPLQPREKWQFMVAITATEFAEAVFEIEK